jgi:hypothetical protein
LADLLPGVPPRLQKKMRSIFVKIYSVARFQRKWLACASLLLLLFLKTEQIHLQNQALNVVLGFLILILLQARYLIPWTS